MENFLVQNLCDYILQPNKIIFKNVWRIYKAKGSALDKFVKNFVKNACRIGATFVV